MKKIIIANWKMNPESQAKAKALLVGIKNGVSKAKSEVVICPPYVYLDLCSKFHASGFKVGAQNCFWEEKGAFTGEISPTMLRDLGVKYVLIGHSEREQSLCESHQMANKKIALLLEKGSIPVLCVGETKVQREKGEAFSSIEKELKECLIGIPKTKISSVIIAYEPIWAIGSGNYCKTDDALTAILFIRKLISEIIGKKTSGEQIKVLYGGSVNATNASEYLSNDWIDGLLVGSSSLNAKEFLGILKNV